MARRLMTSGQAFKAMFSLLKEYYSRTGSDDVGSLLGNLSLLADGKPMDAGIWQDWIRCVDNALKGEVDASFGITDEK